MWTLEDLAAERKDFFDTRVTGRVEVWQAIKTALEVLWDSDPNRPPGTTAPTQEQQEEALLTAQSIMMAADITLPTGNLAQGVYDQLGNYYPLPEHVVCNPVNVINASDLPPSEDGDEIDDDEGDMGSIGDTKQPYVASSAEDDETDRAAQRRKEKGKEVEVEEETITVRCRLSENARDVLVTVPKKSPVRILARRIVEEAKVLMHSPPLRFLLRDLLCTDQLEFSFRMTRAYGSHTWERFFATRHLLPCKVGRRDMYSTPCASSNHVRSVKCYLTQIRILGSVKCYPTATWMLGSAM